MEVEPKLRTVTIGLESVVPAIGQGCGLIGLGKNSKNKIDEADEISALQLGIELGMRFIDTAEVYADGNSERIVGQAIRGRRDKVFLATKFSPENSSYKSVIHSLEGSLRRLGTDYVDLYQAHWPNPAISIDETMSALIHLVNMGKIRNIGLSNFSKREFLKAQASLPEYIIVSNQLEYNLIDRFVEQEMLPFCQASQRSLIAYSPLDKGRNAEGDPREIVLKKLSIKYGKKPSQIALVWLTSKSGVLAIPSSSNKNHLKENAEALDFIIEKEDLLGISEVFNPKPLSITTDSIKVSLSGEGSKLVYQTREEAISNVLKLAPSPLELASFIKAGDPIKPVRLIPNSEKNSPHTYDLVEGRLRYWAWVLAFNGDKPIPAYVRYA